MTHEELQLKIYQIDKYNEATDEQGTENWHEVDKALQALRAVVELHKPNKTGMAFTYCRGCKSTLVGQDNCITIQAIEKELC